MTVIATAKAERIIEYNPLRNEEDTAGSPKTACSTQTEENSLMSVKFNRFGPHPKTCTDIREFSVISV
ncbi:MAG: hypothetical protein DHS20C16_03960 [Phycisphaerae bacterium]|nr:MAG: hypothetical protein DHS20C16_03960 [Phycisphaerae bacterium]